MSGGLDKLTINPRRAVNLPNSLVEQYDVCSNTWTDFPSMMVHQRFRHGSVGLKNKLYMIAGDQKDMEVYDSISKKFMLIITSKIFRYRYYFNKVMILNID